MSHTIPLEQASARLRELVGALGPGDEIVLTVNDEEVAKIVPAAAAPKRREPGAWRGKLEILDDGDDVILDHFRDYAP